MDIHSKGLRERKIRVDFCVVGGGLAGMSAAISAARAGLSVAIMQDRPMFGGNCSSEIRMWVRGAHGLHNRETGIVNELNEENIYRNPTLNYSLWDTVLYEAVKQEKNIEAILNCSCLDAETVDGRIVSVTGWQLTTYTFIKVYATYFADCSGDSVLAPITGALYRVGREGNDEFGETIGPKIADRKTMGMSCLMQARETDHPVKFTPPSWAYVYNEDADFDFREKDTDNRPDVVKSHSLSRNHELATCGGNFWWMELGGDRDSIHDTEEMRDELLKIALGIWDHIKNRGDHHADNWELEWLGFLPGKRESRRYVGAYTLTQNDVTSGGHFDDIIAYGGWGLDDHHPGGFYAVRSAASRVYEAPSPYGIPYGVIYSKNIKNLFFAGRNISATHAALSSTRVMATCAVIGQAMGTAVGFCVKEGLTPAEVGQKRIRALQDALRDAGCYLPFTTRSIPALTLSAKSNLTEEQKALLYDGIERPDEQGTVHYIDLPIGGEIVYRFDKTTPVESLRVLFDLDYDRTTVAVNKKLGVYAQKCNTGLDFVPLKVAATLVKSFAVYADGEEIFRTDDCHRSLVRVPVGRSLCELRVRFEETWGAPSVHLFSCDIR